MSKWHSTADKLPKQPGLYQVVWSHKPAQVSVAGWDGRVWATDYSGDALVWVKVWRKLSKLPRHLLAGGISDD